MKKRITAIILIGLFLVTQDKQSAIAQESNPCATDLGKVAYEDEGRFGFDITRAKKTFPNFPIVIGQDMEEKTGVNINVEIQSIPGKIAYEVPVRVWECAGHKNPGGTGADPCPAPYDDGKYYYMDYVDKCAVRDETVYRTINGESVKVWLAPSADTLLWLGWNTDDTNGKNPLRYMFPEKWALGTWTPEGYTTVGSDFMFTEEQINAIIEANPGFEFLKGDPRAEDIPTYALQRAQDPHAPTQRVLALFGDFTNWYTQSIMTMEGPCLVDRPGMQGHCQTATNLSVGNPETELFNADLSAEGITYLRVELLNVPMDLPGDWYIGVSVHVWPAKYDNGARTEIPPDETKLYRYPDSGYDINAGEHLLTVYILISTLCNSAEIDGCTM